MQPLAIGHGLQLARPAIGSGASGRQQRNPLLVLLQGILWRVCLACVGLQTTFASNPVHLLHPEKFTHYFDHFAAFDPQTVTNHIPNTQASAWLCQNIPLFECPDRDVEEIFYFRWWSYRKHLVKTPAGFVVTEFLTPVKHAGAYNTVSCAAGLQLAEGRWLREDRYLDDYTRFWLRGYHGRSQPHFHKFSSWFAAAVYDRYLVNGDKKFLVNLLPDLVADYRAWEAERRTTNGLFWQFDVADAMEESISGSRTEKNLRPTINSYMFANARALAAIARIGGKAKLAAEFSAKAAELKCRTQEMLWDADAQFFKVKSPAGKFADVREELGFIPWFVGLPDSNKGYAAAWAQLTDAHGFAAPFGITTAERRHPRFRSHGVGTCEWDGAVWPFATSQTLTAFANFLRAQDDVSSGTYFDAFLTYTRSQRANGQPYIGEYLDEVTGDWINRNGRSAYYNHSTYADLLITGVVGLVPRADDVVEINPLLPPGTWDWFCLDGVKYHGHILTVIWDKDGSRYGRGTGLRVLADGKPIASSQKLERITGKLP